MKKKSRRGFPDRASFRESLGVPTYPGNTILEMREEPADEDRTEIEKAWIEEALRRDAEMESGQVEGLPGDEVFRKIRASRH